MYLFDGKSRVGIDYTSRDDRTYIQSNSERRRESYSIFDLFGSYQFNSNLLLQLRVANVFDELYTKRAIVEIDEEDVTTYQPGRNVKFTVEYKF